MFSFKNINKGWITSLVGYLLIFACLVSVFLKGTTWADAALGMAVGITLLGLPNPPMPGGGTTGVVGVLVLSLMFGGCVSLKKCQDKYGTQGPPTTLAITDTMRIPVTVTTPADSLATHLSIDSLARATSTDTVRLVSPGSRVEVSYWRSPAAKPGGSAQLNFRAKVPLQIIHDTVTKVVTLYGKCPPTWTFQPSTNTHWYYRWWGYYRTFSTYAFSAGLLVLAIWLGVKLRPRLL